MKYRVLLILFIGMTATCMLHAEQAKPESQPDAKAKAKPAPEAEQLPTGLEPTDKRYLYEVMRHIYRWYLDEHDVHDAIKRGEVVAWVRELKPELDAGDKSRFAEIIFPGVGIEIEVKRADYQIEELNLEVKNNNFMITSGQRIDPPKTKPDDAVEVVIDYDDMLKYLFKTRGALEPPNDQLLERFREATHRHTRDYLKSRDLEMPKHATLHLGPLSPVASETWVYWEEGRLLYHFSSDIDLTNPKFWDQEELAVDVYSIDENVVVSLEEVTGSNAYLTRDMVGRVLFNCLVFGRKVELKPETEPAATP